MFNLNNFKMKKFLVAAMALLAFMSCSKEGPNNQQDGKKAYISFGITQSAVTRASEAPTAGEAVMGDWTIYVFNSAQSLIKIVDVASPATVTDAIELTATKHYFLFAVNKPGAPNAAPAIALNENIDDVEMKLMENFATIAPITTANGSGGTDFYITNVKREEIVLNSGTTESTPQTATIQVGRGMVKARLNPTTSATQTGNGQLLSATVKYLGAGNPDAMYAFPHRNTNGQLLSPYFTDATVTMSQYFPTLQTVMTGWENPSSASGDGIYMMENSNNVPKQGNSSFLLIQGSYEPATWVLKDGTDAGAYTANTTFYRVGKKVDPGTNDKIASFLPYILSEDITTNSEMEAFLDFVDPDGLGAGNYTTEVPKYGVEEYVNGVTYYALYLGDQSLSTSTARYTVARNYLYNVTINEITGPGYGDPGNVIPDKEKPLEEEAFLKVTITVAPWEMINQGGILGN